MRHVFVVALLLTISLVSGCATLTGSYYLESEQYEEGVRAMRAELRDAPDDPSAHYYLGRYYLALNKPEPGLASLKQASALEPGNADYHFWTGVAYWAALEPKLEREAYLRAVSIDKDHISANLYLGHGYTDEGRWDEALVRYDKVLKQDKYNPEALYNRAVALNGMGRHEEEVKAWKKFLGYYPDGSLAMQATANLNRHGDFSYRNFIIGQRNVTLRTMNFKPGTIELDMESKESLHVVKAMLRENDTLALHIVAYASRNKDLAKARAKAVRDYMINVDPGFDQSRLPLSWFDSAELVEIEGKSFLLDDSVRFITVVR